MKIRLYTLAAVAALLASCGKDPVPAPVVEPDYVIYTQDVYEFDPAEVPSFGVKSRTDSLIHLDFKCVRADNEEIVIIEYQTEVEPRDTAAYNFFSPTEWDVIHDYILKGTVALGSGSPKPFEKSFKVVPCIQLDFQNELDHDYLYSFTRYIVHTRIYPTNYCSTNRFEFKAEQTGLESIEFQGTAPYAYTITMKTDYAGTAQVTVTYGEFSKTFPLVVKSNYHVILDSYYNDAVRISLKRDMSEKGAFLEEIHGLEDCISTTVTVKSTVEYSQDNLSTTGYENLPTIKDTSVVEKTFTTALYGKDIEDGIHHIISSTEFDELMKLREVESVKYNPEKSTTDIDGNTVPGFDRTTVKYQPLSMDISVNFNITSDPEYTEASFTDQWSLRSFHGWGKELLSSSFDKNFR